jgi:WD40 repeat protein
VATGQTQAKNRGKVKPAVHIWDATSTALVVVLGGVHSRAVRCVAFSGDGSTLVSVGGDDDHTIAVWSSLSRTWGDGKLLSQAKSSREASVLFAVFTGSLAPTPQDRGGAGESKGAAGEDAFSDVVLCTGGVKHIFFWTLNGRALKSKPGKLPKATTTLCCAAAVRDQGLVAAGTSDGQLLLWKDPKAAPFAVDSGHGSVRAVVWHQVHGLTSSGRDGIVRFWRVTPDCKLDKLEQFAVTGGCADSQEAAAAADAARRRGAATGGASAAGAVPSVQSLCWMEGGSGIDDDTLVVGTTACDILTFFKTGRPARPGNPPTPGGSPLVVSGHCNGELWGIAAHPTNPQLFASCGDDAIVRLWDSQAHAPLASFRVSASARCLSFSPDGSLLAVGLGSMTDIGTKSTRRAKAKSEAESKANFGGLVVLRVDLTHAENKVKAATLKKASEHKGPKEWCQDVKFSPDGAMIALGSHDNKVYLYEVDASGAAADSKMCVDKSNSFITHMDWSADSTRLQTTDGAYELLFYAVPECKQQTSATALRDTAWASWTCTFGWPVQASPSHRSKALHAPPP